MKMVLLLEDNTDRIGAFREATTALGKGWGVQVWRDAATMIAECEGFLEKAAVISLDHDLERQPGAAHDPGTGLEAASFLAAYPPVCPVIIHSSNADRAWSMHNELRFAGWRVERVGPIGDDWIHKLWLPKARELVNSSRPRVCFQKPGDHSERMDRALLSLEGLGIGDALGEMLSYRHAQAVEVIARDLLPAGPWFHTDDTEMAISIVEVLRMLGHIDQDTLVRRFAWRFDREPDRGYGKMTRIQMRAILAGADWHQTAASAFGGQGSMGNGGAMRVAPLGGYFADDLKRVVAESTLSATVTHMHPEGVAGAIAVAVAAAMAWRLRDSPQDLRVAALLNAVLLHTPESKVRQGLVIAAGTPRTVPSVTVAQALGNGSLVTAPDTVPFAIWCAASHLDDYAGALVATVSCGGDCDTNAAIVGGITALSTGRHSIPAEWRTAREALPFPQLKVSGQ
jgi:ADP-ribosylglycohydrolase